MKMLIGLALGLVVSTAAMADFMPENNLYLEDLQENASMTEERFNEIIDQAVAIYEPIIAAYDKKLKVNRKWSNSTVNASAQQLGSTWVVNMYGGLARRDEVTEDGFALVVCHEIGHHLGGFPYSHSWAADEGQSDYFATLSCGRQLWERDFEGNAKAAEKVEGYAKNKCDEAWTLENDRNLCYRQMNAGYSLADLLSGGSGVAHDTPDQAEVSSTNHRHPAAQCRLDTYMLGALCQAQFNPALIPGKEFNNRNGLEAEEQSAEVTCTKFNGDTIGVRSRCWYKPSL